MKTKTLITSLTLTGLLFAPVNIALVQADTPVSQSVSVSSNSGQAIQKRALSKSYMVFGSGLSQSEQSNISSVLANGQDASDFTDLVANAQDYNEFLNNGQSSNTTDAEMISSVAISPADPGSGINVNIKNFNGQNNITQVTQQQYAMAAQMAGVTDVNIIVSANRPVSGTSALTGVYEALSQDGIQLNNQNTASANRVLKATQQATNGLSNADKNKVVQATGQTANQIAKDNRAGQPDSQSQIADILKNNLDKQGVNLNNSQINILTNSLNNFKSTPVAQTKDFASNMHQTLDNIKDAQSGNMISAKNWMKNHENWFTHIWNKIKTWWRTNIEHKSPVQIQNASSSSDNNNANDASTDASNNSTSASSDTILSSSSNNQSTSSSSMIDTTTSSSSNE